MSESAEELAVDAPPVAVFRADPSFPLKVTYCGECSLPMEPKARGKRYRRSGCPGSTLPSKEVGCVGCVDGEGAAEAYEGVEEEEKKRQKRGGKGQIKTKKKAVPQKVTIAKIPRAKKKFVTRVCGLATFGIELREAQKLFAQRFSCGASVTAEDEVTIQGDVTDGVMDVIQQRWPEVDDESVEDLGEVKR